MPGHQAVVPAAIAPYAEKRINVLHEKKMVWFNLTGQEQWSWHAIFNWNFWQAQGITRLAPDEAAAMDQVVENLQEELIRKDEQLQRAAASLQSP